MKLAKELITVMGDRLEHMHVSGCSESEIQVPTFWADNKDAIIEILKLGLDVPKILEGILLDDISNTITAELSYVKSFEKDSF